MHFWELLLLAVGLSMDAFAVAACTGLSLSRVTARRALTVAFYFGAFQALMPLAGWLLATRLADEIAALDHWIAFSLLCLIGGKMIRDSFQKGNAAGRAQAPAARADGAYPGGARPAGAGSPLRPAKMLPLAVATSIDALAVGVSLAFLRVDILPAASFIGAITFVLSMLGVKIGGLFGVRLQSKAALAGGVILILIGLKILLEHTGVIYP